MTTSGVRARLVAAGCVAADEEAEELVAAAPDAATLEGWVRRILDQVTLADLLQSEGQAVARLRANLPADEVEVLSPLLPLTTLRR